MLGRGRDRRDRAARHRRPGAPTARSARWWSPRSTRTTRWCASAPATCRPCCRAPAPTGRTNTRIKGWMGRADQTTKVRGMFVHPGQVAEIARRFPSWCGRGWWSSGEMANDRMTLQVEAASPAAGPGRAHGRGACATSPSCAARCSWWRPGSAAQRRQGDRGRAQLPLATGARLMRVKRRRRARDFDQPALRSFAAPASRGRACLSSR